MLSLQHEYNFSASSFVLIVFNLASSANLHIYADTIAGTPAIYNRWLDKSHLNRYAFDEDRATSAPTLHHSPKWHHGSSCRCRRAAFNHIYTRRPSNPFPSRHIWHDWRRYFQLSPSPIRRRQPQQGLR